MFIASEDSRDVEVLKTAALQSVALDYRERSETYHKLKRRQTSRDKADS